MSHRGEWYNAGMARRRRNQHHGGEERGHASAGRSAQVTGSDPDSIGVVFFGMAGTFSALPFEALLRAGFAVRAVVIPTPAVAHASGSPADQPPYRLLPTRRVAPARRALPLVGARTGASAPQRAGELGMPVLEVARLDDPATVAALAAFAPDVIAVACFSLRLPPAILRLPRLGCLNVHPSLLPANRGPDPLFWTFRHGDVQTGTTVHLMDAGLDTGPILCQRPVPVPDGISEAELERTCAEIGGGLLVEAVRGLAAGTLQPIPQDEARATRFPFPTAADFEITPDRPARWADNFARGVLGRGEPVIVRTASAAFRLTAPLGYDAGEKPAEPWRREGDELWLRCTPGVLHARVVPLA
jgi:methionyl-tRNA formyltransferase